jgi:hypothetical protein
MIMIIIANKYKYGHGLLQFRFGFALKYDLRKVQENREKRIVWGDSFCPPNQLYTVLPLLVFQLHNVTSIGPVCSRTSVFCWRVSC